ncbi:MAG: SH3 domain-containing protein [Shimia sp.]
MIRPHLPGVLLAWTMAVVPTAATEAPVIAPANETTVATAGAAPAEAVPEGERRGPVTSFPLPRFISMKAAKANVRRGPSLSHRIDWVYTHRGMPLKITAEHGHWRRVQDRDGLGGWIHYSLLSGARTVIVEEDMMALFPRPMAEGPVRARLEAGVIARLTRCEDGWCRLTVSGHKGWAPATSLWGAGLATE